MPDINVSTSLIPGEALLTSIFNYASIVRSTMSPEIANRFDLVHINMLEHWCKIWHKLGIFND